MTPKLPALEINYIPMNLAYNQIYIYACKGTEYIQKVGDGTRGPKMSLTPITRFSLVGVSISKTTPACIAVLYVWL